MKAVAVLPARMGSSRFPGKPLAMLKGISMIEHVYQRTKLSTLVKDVYVATCDAEIADVVQGFGGRAIMTSPKHERASDRIAEVAESVDADVYVMVQGDEPMIFPEMIDLSLQPMLSEPAVLCANLVAPIRTEEEFKDRNCIKVVMDKKGNALYFSREPIPTLQLKPFAQIEAFKQVCVIPFRKEGLKLYSQLAPTPLEKAESIDMMRFLEHGYQVRMARCDFATQSVDTPQDLAKVDKLLDADRLLPKYLKKK